MEKTQQSYIEEKCAEFGYDYELWAREVCTCIMNISREVWKSRNTHLHECIQLKEENIESEKRKIIQEYHDLDVIEREKFPHMCIIKQGAKWKTIQELKKVTHYIKNVKEYIKTKLALGKSTWTGITRFMKKII